MNPFTLLKDDHETFKKMLSELDATTDRAEKTRTQIFDRLKRELVAHETIEEEILYPAIREKARTRDDRDLVLEAFAEHHVADVIVAELSELPVTDEMWGAKATVLRESLEHHIEEEEGDLFHHRAKDPREGRARRHRGPDGTAEARAPRCGSHCMKKHRTREYAVDIHRRGDR